MRLPPIEPNNNVFLNIPYDEAFRDLYIAYVVGLYQVGLTPHVASEIPGGERRLDRIFALIKSCRYSIHDLSRVELSGGPSSAPRFNMPLELGLAISWSLLNPDLHKWFVWESEPFRIQRSASDLNGTDPNIHFGTVEGVLGELRNAFWWNNAPSVETMLEVYRGVELNFGAILSLNGTRNPYAPGVFKEMCLFISRLTTLLRASRSSWQ